MLVITGLLAHALLIGGPVTRALAGASWVSRHPQAALRLWHSCALGLLASVSGALVLAAHDLWEHGMVWLFHADKPLIHTAYGGAWQARGITEVALLALLLGMTGLSWTAARRSLRVRRARDRHRLTADAQGSHGRGDDPAVRVLAHAAPAAFCIPGPPGRSRIVVTTAAQDLLSPEERAAILEHERAHLRLRHHRAILTADVLTAALGWMGLLRPYADQVRRLAEMAADDQAARKHGRRTVASALLEMCTAPGTADAAPPGTVAMTGPDPAERIRRLISAPPAVPGRLSRALTGTAAAVALAVPVLVAMAPALLLANTAHLPGAG
ncbi:M56 family metallopeptidase [Streptomyces coeruleorubidus]|jgi:Zn-dependent protease with chaperone function|uniref:M56 family metallopeptidase n=1 Tax=Streptomyces coeruleorubidus TaxID=116188 RepID=UPI00381100B0